MGLSLRKFLEPVSLLSLSNLPTLGKLCEDLARACEASDTILNYNKVATRKTAKDKHFKTGCRAAEMIYVIMYKPPLGGDVHPDSLAHTAATLDSAAEEVGRTKVNLDTCVLEAARYRLEGLACSAGISKVTVWPDGSATGCPYDSNHIVSKYIYNDSGQIDTHAELIYATEIRETQPIEHCHLTQKPSDLYYSPPQKGVEPQQEQS
jgi:hypothetical protein